MGLLNGKVAVITGAGSGMAKASTKVFVREGARVVAADVSGAEKDTAAEVGEGVLPVHCDVTREGAVAAMFETAIERFGRVDAVLNVAGIGEATPITDVTMEQYDRVMDVDLRGVLLGMKHGVRAMLPTGGGAIINWSSVGGLNAALATSVYSAAKAGVIAITKAAAVEYGPHGIRANALCPGFILTGDHGRVGSRALPPDADEGRPQAGGAATGSGRGRRLPRIRPRVVRHRCDHPRRRRLGRIARVTGDSSPPAVERRERR